MSAAAGQMVLRFESLEAVRANHGSTAGQPALHKHRVQFFAATVQGRDLAPPEVLRHPVSQPSDPLGEPGLRVRAEVGEAPASLVAVVFNEQGHMVGGRAFTVDEAPTVGKHTAHALELDCTEPPGGTALILHFLVKHAEVAPNSPVVATPKAPPIKKETGGAGSSWLTQMMVRFNCRAANTIDG